VFTLHKRTASIRGVVGHNRLGPVRICRAGVGAVTVNMLLRILMAFRYSPMRDWPHRRINYFRLHNCSGYLALFISILQPIILLFYKERRFRVLDIVYPVHSPSQPLDNTIGPIALYNERSAAIAKSGFGGPARASAPSLTGYFPLFQNVNSVALSVVLNSYQHRKSRRPNLAGRQLLERCAYYRRM
jgi:hypothetical protein